MDLKEQTRQRDRARYFAMDTLRMVLEWITATNPQNYLNKGAKDVYADEEKAKMREWVEKSGDLIDKTWALPEMLATDAIKILSEATGIEPLTAPPAKP